MEEKIKGRLKISLCNKIGGLVGVAVVWVLSFILVNNAIDKFNTEKGVLEKKIVTKGLDNVQLNILNVPLDTSNCILPIELETIPVVETEIVYNNSISVLLHISIILFIVLVLWGAFTFLFKVLKSEHEINSKVLDVELDIYKEQKMAYISNGKKENNNAEEEKEKAKKYEEVLKKMEMLEKSIDFIKAKTSYDDKKILDSLKEYIGVVESK